MNQRPAFSSPEHPNIVDAVTFFTTCCSLSNVKPTTKRSWTFPFWGFNRNLSSTFVRLLCNFLVLFFPKFIADQFP